MRGSLAGLTALGCLLLLLAGCAPRPTIILVPDPDGHVGRAEVTTRGGTQVLERASDLTRVSGPSAPPAPVTTADPAYITKTFAEAMAVEPLPSEKFILYFETGTAVLVPESQATIGSIVAAIQRRAALSINISGHTDAVGSDRLNNQLARERAAMVKELLLKQGVDPNRVTVTSHGKGNPLVPTPDGVAEPKNRRVEVVVR